MMADALTKVVMLTGEQSAALLPRYDASALFVSANGDLLVTRDWSDELHVSLACQRLRVARLC